MIKFLVFFLAVLVVSLSIIFFSGGSVSQQSDQPTVPDHKDWNISAKEVRCTLNDEEVVLWSNLFVKSREGSDDNIFELFDKSGEPWLLVYAVASSTSESWLPLKYHLFEFKNGSWSFVRKFDTNEPILMLQEVVDFMLGNYNLVCF